MAAVKTYAWLPAGRRSSSSSSISSGLKLAGVIEAGQNGPAPAPQPPAVSRRSIFAREGAAKPRRASAAAGRLAARSPAFASACLNRARRRLLPDAREPGRVLQESGAEPVSRTRPGQVRRGPSRSTDLERSGCSGRMACSPAPSSARSAPTTQGPRELDNASSSERRSSAATRASRRESSRAI